MCVSIFSVHREINQFKQWCLSDCSWEALPADFLFLLKWKRIESGQDPEALPGSSSAWLPAAFSTGGSYILRCLTYVGRRGEPKEVTDIQWTHSEKKLSEEVFLFRVTPCAGKCQFPKVPGHQIAAPQPDAQAVAGTRRPRN